MELTRGSDHDAACGKEERDEEADTEIGHRKSAVLRCPALAEHGVGEEEGHIDADGGAEGGDDDIALIARDERSPGGGIVAC